MPLGSPIEREREREERPKELEDVHGGEVTMSRLKERRRESLWLVQEMVGMVGLQAWWERHKGLRGKEKHWPEGFRFPTRSLGFTCRKWEAGRVYFEPGGKWWTWCLKKTQEALAQGPANYCHQAKAGLPSVFVNKVLLEHSGTHLYVYCPWLLSRCKGRIG